MQWVAFLLTIDLIVRKILLGVNTPQRNELKEFSQRAQMEKPPCLRMAFLA